MSRIYVQSEGTAARRRFPVYLVDATDGLTPETGENGGQPQISKVGAAFGNTTATLTAVGNGHYYVELTTTELNTLGYFAIRYKSANTAEFNMDGLVVAIDIHDSVRAGLTALPNAAADAAGGLPISDAGGLDLDGLNTNVSSILTDTGTTLPGVLGTPTNLGGGATLADNNADMAGATFATATDSQEAIRNRGDAAWITATSVTVSDKTGFSLAADQSAVTVGAVSGAVGSVTGAVGSVTGNVGGNVTGSVGSLAAQAKTDVNAEVVDALATDTYAEPGQGAPAATTSLAAKLNYLYKSWRNKKDNDGSTTNLYNDAGAVVDQKQTTSEAAGTVTKAEWVTGP